MRKVALALVLVLAGCSFFPSAGPLRGDIQDESESGNKPQPFMLVEVSGDTVETLKRRSAPSFAGMFGGGDAPPELVVGPGDGLSVTIWEAGSQPLFASVSAMGTPMQASAHGTTLPEQVVDREGTISIPFVGRVPVQNRTLAQVQAAIEQGLTGKTAKPQVLVTLAHNVTNAVTVVGEGTADGRIPLTPRGDRLLDVLAATGGIRAPTYETRVTLMRGGQSVMVPVVQLLADPAENVYLHPGDVLIVTRQPETFTAFGATGRNAQIAFETARVSLVEAVAKAGGLQDLRADPRGVFLFRREPAAVATALGKGRAPAGATVPVVYRLDLTRAGGYFLANEFDLRDGDVLYVSSAPANELTKFLQLIGLVSQPAVGAALINNSIK